MTICHSVKKKHLSIRRPLDVNRLAPLALCLWRFRVMGWRSILARTIEEGRHLVEIVEKSDRIVQIGNQRRSGKHWEKARDMVPSGKIGPLRFIRTWDTRYRPKDQTRAPRSQPGPHRAPNAAALVPGHGWRGEAPRLGLRCSSHQLQGRSPVASQAAPCRLTLGSTDW